VADRRKKDRGLAHGAADVSTTISALPRGVSIDAGANRFLTVF